MSRMEMDLEIAPLTGPALLAVMVADKQRLFRSRAAVWLKDALHAERKYSIVSLPRSWRI
ncbi:hypothetical protein BO221_13095 [Archangium sp. Cb G35]|nr:hypothetical protein BO221_13095 [Archangium sp. Cb G35]